MTRSTTVHSLLTSSRRYDQSVIVNISIVVLMCCWSLRNFTEARSIGLAQPIRPGELAEDRLVGSGEIFDRLLSASETSSRNTIGKGDFRRMDSGYVGEPLPESKFLAPDEVRHHAKADANVRNWPKMKPDDRVWRVSRRQAAASSDDELSEEEGESDASWSDSDDDLPASFTTARVSLVDSSQHLGETTTPILLTSSVTEPAAAETTESPTTKDVRITSEIDTEDPDIVTAGEDAQGVTSSTFMPTTAAPSRASDPDKDKIDRTLDSAGQGTTTAVQSATELFETTEATASTREGPVETTLSVETTQESSDPEPPSLVATSSTPSPVDMTSSLQEATPPATTVDIDKDCLPHEEPCPTRARILGANFTGALPLGTTDPSVADKDRPPNLQGGIPFLELG